MPSSPLTLAAEHVPVQMEDGLAGARADVHDDAVVVEAGALRGLGDEVQHPLRLVGRELADLAEGRHVALGQHEQVRVGAAG